MTDYRNEQPPQWYEDMTDNDLIAHARANQPEVIKGMLGKYVRTVPDSVYDILEPNTKDDRALAREARRCWNVYLVNHIAIAAQMGKLKQHASDGDIADQNG